MFLQERKRFMAKINRELAENIHINLANHLREHYERYYLLAYSLVKNQEAAVQVVSDIVYFSLYNGRKLKNLPPMHVWFLQLVIRNGMRTMIKNVYPRDFNKESQLYSYMETLEPSGVNVFRLFYFEELNVEKTADVLNLSVSEVRYKLDQVRRELKIDSSHDEESMERLEELVDVYESAPIPENLYEEIEKAIEREEENFAKFYQKYKRDKLVKPLGLVLVTAAFILITIFLGRRNPIFAESVLNMPLVNKFFGHFF